MREGVFLPEEVIQGQNQVPRELSSLFCTHGAIAKLSKGRARSSALSLLCSSSNTGTPGETFSGIRCSTTGSKWVQMHSRDAVYLPLHSTEKQLRMMFCGICTVGNPSLVVFTLPSQQTEPLDNAVCLISLAFAVCALCS